ncbi:MAG: diguanylate cyclase, partial [Cellulosilyticaceae bacterium]
MGIDHKQIDDEIYELIQKGAVEEALTYCQRVIDTTDQKDHLYIYALMGQAYMWLSDYPKALEQLYRGLHLAKNIKDQGTESRVCTVMAACEILHTNNIERAKELQLRAYSLAKEVDSLNLIMSSGNNLGILYTNEGAFDKALAHFEEIIKYRDKAQGYRQLNVIIAATINIGDIYFKRQAYDQAIKCWEGAIDICKEKDIPRHLAIVYFNIASVYKEQSKYQKALVYYDKALEIQIDLSNKKEESMCYKDISSVYEDIEDYKNALIFYKCYTEITESIVNDETRLQIQLVEDEYTDNLRMLNKQLLEANKQLEKAKNEIEYLYVRDFLTDTYNRRGLQQEMEKLESYYKDNGLYYHVMMIDIDDFKIINDQFGHQIGDQVLSKCAHVLKEVVGGDGIVSRYGGEEFVVVLKYMSEDKVRAIAQKILQTIRETPYCLGAE